jgi:hypothetical protein
LQYFPFGCLPKQNIPLTSDELLAILAGTTGTTAAANRKPD